MLSFTLNTTQYSVSTLIMYNYHSPICIFQIIAKLSSLIDVIIGAVAEQRSCLVTPFVLFTVSSDRSCFSFHHARNRSIYRKLGMSLLCAHVRVLLCGFSLLHTISFILVI
jgi:hypothetical protein